MYLPTCILFSAIHLTQPQRVPIFHDEIMKIEKFKHFQWALAAMKATIVSSRAGGNIGI